MDTHYSENFTHLTRENGQKLVIFQMKHFCSNMTTFLSLKLKQKMFK